MSEIEQLNQRHAIPDQLTFTEGPGGLPVAQVRNSHAGATIALHGAHVLHFRPHGHDPLLWLSSAAIFAPDVAIRGGIPICWPWFAAHPADASKPQHGFVRTMPWHVLDGAAHDDRTELRLGVSDSEATRAIWPHAFELELLVTVGATLELALITRNIDRAPFTISAALHSYLTVGDAGAIAIEGLDGHDYIDKVAGGARARQAGAVTLADETDRIYLDAPGSCTVIDPALSRRIEIAKAGSRTTVSQSACAATKVCMRLLRWVLRLSQIRMIGAWSWACAGAINSA